MISPVAREKDYRHVSPVDDSKPTIPRSWRMGGASCRRPRTASSDGNPTLSTVKPASGRCGKWGNWWKLSLRRTQCLSLANHYLTLPPFPPRHLLDPPPPVP